MGNLEAGHGCRGGRVGGWHETTAAPDRREAAEIPGPGTDQAGGMPEPPGSQAVDRPDEGGQQQAHGCGGGLGRPMADQHHPEAVASPLR